MAQELKTLFYDPGIFLYRIFGSEIFFSKTFGSGIFFKNFFTYNFLVFEIFFRSNFWLQNTFFLTILKISSLFFTISKLKIAMNPDFNLTFFFLFISQSLFLFKIYKKKSQQSWWGEIKSWWGGRPKKGDQKGPGDAAAVGFSVTLARFFSLFQNATLSVLSPPRNPPSALSFSCIIYII